MNKKSRCIFVCGPSADGSFVNHPCHYVLELEETHSCVGRRKIQCISCKIMYYAFISCSLRKFKFTENRIFLDLNSIRTRFIIPESLRAIVQLKPHVNHFTEEKKQFTQIGYTITQSRCRRSRPATNLIWFWVPCAMHADARFGGISSECLFHLPYRSRQSIVIRSCLINVRVFLSRIIIISYRARE